MYNFKIDKLVLKNSEEIIPNKINIIVGPNSAGKSTFLKDIRSMLDSAYDYKIKFIDKIEFELPKTSEELINCYDIENKLFEHNGSMHFKDYTGSKLLNISTDPNINNLLENSNYYIGYNWQEELNNIISDNNKESFLNTYGHFFVSYLGTEEKLLAIKVQNKYSKYDNQTNFLSEIMFMDDVFEDLRKTINSILNVDIILDFYTLGSKIGFRVGTNMQDFNKIKIDKYGEKRNYLEKYTLLDYEGDGIKNFVATFLFLRYPHKNIILLDEPESYLHPPVARKMGKVIVQNIDSNKQIFAATHSAEIIKGIILNAKKNINDISIIYIRNDNNKRVVKSIKIADIKNLVGNSTILFSNILNGLFSKRVYITESYNDSYFYDALFNKIGKIDDYYFVNAQGKSEIYKIFNFFQELGAKTTAIYDFDFFRNKDDIKKLLLNRVEETLYNKIIKYHQDLNKYITNMVDKNIPEKERTSKIKEVKDEMFHLKGLNGLSDDLKNRGLETIEILRKYNIVVLATGALETTLINEGIKSTTNKEQWIKDAIELIEKNSKTKLENIEIYNILK